MGGVVSKIYRGLMGRGGWRGRLRVVLAALVVVFLLGPLAAALVYRVAPVPATPLMVLRLFEGEGWSKSWRSLEEIDPYLPLAVIAAEDNRFCAHHGFDVEAIRQAIEEAQAGQGLRGASTISMQTAKNVYLWDWRSFIRKGMEAYYTLYLELLWPKTRIMEVYLNIAEWAPGVYGAEAAARHHFGKSASELTNREAALLAAVLPSPRNWSAGQPGAYVSRRAGTIQTRVQQLGPLLDCLRRDQ